MHNDSTLSRKRFLALAGGSAAALLFGGKVHASVRYEVMDVREYGVKGDGSDESKLIQKCLDENLRVHFPEVPKGYGYDASRGLLIRSGHQITGAGGKGKFLRLLNGSKKNFGFVNHIDEPVDDVLFYNLYFAGRGRKDNGYRWDLINEDWDDRVAGSPIWLHTRPGDLNVCDGITIVDFTVTQWPGQVVKMLGGKDLKINRLRGHDCARGGLVLGRYWRNVRIANTAITESGDDCIALGCSGPEGAPEEFTYDAIIYRSGGTTRQSKVRAGGGNAGIAVRGARNVRVLDCFHRGAQKNGIAVDEYGGYEPRDVLIRGNRVRNSGWSGIGVQTPTARDIHVIGNRIVGAKDHGVSWRARGREKIRRYKCSTRRNRIARVGGDKVQID